MILIQILCSNYSFKGIINKKIEANGFNSKLFLGLGLTFNSEDLNFINGKFFFPLIFDEGLKQYENINKD